MARKVGIFLLKNDADRLRSIQERFWRILAIAGVMPPPLPPDEPQPTPPHGHMPPRVEGDRIVVPEGTAPVDLSDAIRRYWPRGLWGDAARVSYYESVGWDRTAVLDTRSYANGRCNVRYTHPQFGPATTEYSISYFQINSCVHGGTYADWIDADNNARKAYEIYRQQGWSAWLLTSRSLGLLED